MNIDPDDKDLYIFELTSKRSLHWCLNKFEKFPLNFVSKGRPYCFLSNEPSTCILWKILFEKISFWKRTNSAICMYLCTIVTMPLYLTEKPRNVIFRILLEYIRHNIWNLHGFSQNSLKSQKSYQNFSYPIWISRFFFVYLLSLDIDFN